MQDVKNYVAEKRHKKHGNRCEDRSENPSAINLRPAKRTEQAEEQQRRANAKEQKIRPRKIARDRKPGEELIREQPGDCDNKADPDRPVPFSFHVDLAVAIRKIQRYSTNVIAVNARPPTIFPASSNPEPTKLLHSVGPWCAIGAAIEDPADDRADRYHQCC